MARWITQFMPFRYVAHHIKGKDNTFSDYLSRYPVDAEVKVHPPATPPPCDSLNILHRTGHLRILKDFPDIFIDFDASQMSDPELEPIIKSLRDGSNAHPNYILKRNRLYRVLNNGQHRAVVPSALVDTIIRYYHFSKFGSHWGTQRTFQHIRKYFFWKNMHRSIQSQIRGCEVCQKTKSDRTKPQGHLSSSLDTRVGQTLYLDTTGPLPPSMGYRHILIAVDGFSRFTILVPLTTVTSKSIMNALNTHVFRHYGYWERIVTDNATSFSSHKFTSFIHSTGSRHTFLIPYYPNPNLAERQIQNLKTALRAKCHDDHSKWAHDLYLTQLSLNSAFNESTKFSPVELFFGRPLNTPLNLVWDIPSEQLHLPTTWQTAIANIDAAHKRHAAVYNKRHVNVQYSVGDKVLLKTYIISDKQKGITKKLSPKYWGPFQIVKKISDVSYLLQNCEDATIHRTAHVSQLKIFRTNRK
ncbi:unnamed protein product [Nesidiocoris tenuis]|uniref:RNA-directed DNA polymerase n=1 Tax=Nesidiocoris tenuis TaxID=355587 RepID=A0A6H5G312_9HEMI|nr:unnamed protein product [Nesidiocoris tenuis]